MTYKEWEWELKQLLRGLPIEEFDDAIGYYRELYNDKTDAGYTEREILIEFGTPEECAARILSERGGSSRVATAWNTVSSKAKGVAKKARSSSALMGWLKAGLYIFVVFPLTLVWFSLLVSFGAVWVSGVGCAIGGALIAVVGIIQMIAVSGFASSLAVVGGGVAVAGIGLLFIPLGFYLTKWTAKLGALGFRALGGRKEK